MYDNVILCMWKEVIRGCVVLYFISQYEHEDEEDTNGFKFFIYFYLGLYYDSIGDHIMSCRRVYYIIQEKGK